MALSQSNTCYKGLFGGYSGLNKYLLNLVQFSCLVQNKGYATTKGKQLDILPNNWRSFLQQTAKCNRAVSLFLLLKTVPFFYCSKVFECGAVVYSWVAVGSHWPSLGFLNSFRPDYVRYFTKFWISSLCTHTLTHCPAPPPPSTPHTHTHWH